MFSKYLRKTVYEDFVVIDSRFPSKQPRAFRNAEINQYFARIKNFSSYTMSPMKPDADAWFKHGYGVDEKIFKDNKKGYIKFYPENKNRIKYLYPNKRYRIKLAYSFFLAETYTLLNFYEKNKIPFVFTLYPGGGFGLDFDKSDKMLKKIFQSTYFRNVIITQPIVEEYLIRKKLCSEKDMSYMHGGFVQFRREDIEPKQYYGKDKSTFDICFVASKYTKKGIDKGYDLFIDTAKELCKLTDDIKFHVIGGFGPEDIDVTSIRDRINFYGYRKPDFLVKFYSNMDIFLSPNRPFKIYKGNFDGFPLGGDAAFCGVARFVSDELKANRHYIDGKELVIIKLDKLKITKTILNYYNNPSKLYELSKRGQIKTQKILDVDIKINKRLDLFSKYVNLQTI